MFESYEEYLKRTNQEDTRTAWKWWKIEVYGMSEKEAIKASITEYEPIKWFLWILEECYGDYN